MSKRFSLTLSVSTNNSKCLDFFRTGPGQIAMIRSTYFYTISETQGLNRFPILAGKGGKRILNLKVSKQNSILDFIDTYRILWKAVFDESQEKTAKSDPIYRNRLVNMLVNRILKHGKKSLAYQIIYRALKKIQQKTETNPLSVLRQAIRGVTPDIAVKARRSTQGKALAIRWLLGASRKRPGRNMAFKLSSELVDAAKGSGDAIRKKEETHRMAEANRAFAHFR
ncbi:unnamed protein product [Thlaspi arvense]|uniref:Ribosomal protein S7 n=1 Tax=Thlaspi arvense TaxID=13288 RepID=A0AAU9S0J4_THLAR|nr:unnamed protein product [Thlaspi arvense]